MGGKGKGLSIKKWLNARRQSRRAQELGAKIMSKYAHVIWTSNPKFETRDLRNGLRLLRVKCGYPPFVQSRPDLAEFSDVAARRLEVWSLENPGRELAGCPEYVYCLFSKKREA